MKNEAFVIDQIRRGLSLPQIAQRLGYESATPEYSTLASDYLKVTNYSSSERAKVFDKAGFTPSESNSIKDSAFRTVQKGVGMASTLVLNTPHLVKEFGKA